MNSIMRISGRNNLPNLLKKKITSIAAIVATLAMVMMIMVLL